MLLALMGSLSLVSARASAARAACAPEDSRSFALELGPRSNEEAELYTVPQGATFLVTDFIGLHEGSSDSLLRVFTGDRLVAAFPLVGITSHTDLYGVHLVTGLPIPGGQVIRVRKYARGVAWVTVIGCEVRAAPAPSSDATSK